MLLGILITAVACIFAFTTNYLILRVAGKDTNFSDTMHHYFPTWGWSVSMACFIINFYVGIILFFQVLSQSLYPILLFAMGQDVEIEMKTDWSGFSLSYTCLILLGIVLRRVKQGMDSALVWPFVENLIDWTMVNSLAGGRYERAEFN